jgi:hypothetical protein
MGEHGAPSSCEWGAVVLTAEYWRLELHGDFQGKRIGSVELQAILPVVSCFCICRFGEGFASLWLWNPMVAFLGPLIFLFWGTWPLLGYRNVSNLPSWIFLSKMLTLIKAIPKPFPLMGYCFTSVSWKFK